MKLLKALLSLIPSGDTRRTSQDRGVVAPKEKIPLPGEELELSDDRQFDAESAQHLAEIRSLNTRLGGSTSGMSVAQYNAALRREGRGR